jgi:hypothetical protein
MSDLTGAGREMSHMLDAEAVLMILRISGGTSLSKGWELIKRFSEDIDFKVTET